MFFSLKKVFDVELSSPSQWQWQIIKNRDGLLFVQDKEAAFDLFENYANSLNVSSYRINWIASGFEDTYMTLIKRYLPAESSCWLKGDFISENLLNTGSRLILTQTRMFSSKESDNACTYNGKTHSVPDSDHSDVSVSLVDGRGFHRKFHIIKRTNQDIGLLFMITRDAFIDNLSALNEYGSYQIFGDIDLEAAAYDERARLHMLQLNIKGEFVGEFDIPFHLRYQKPIKGGTYQDIKLPHPLVLVQQDSKSLFELPNDILNNSKFSVLQEYDDWTCSIPIGDTNDLYWMPACTIIAILLAIYLVVTANPGFKSKKTK